jgi:hypothetical protein
MLHITVVFLKNNIRNTKNTDKINCKKISFIDKFLLKNRITV